MIISATEIIIHHRDSCCEIDFNIPLEETTVEFKLFECFIKQLQKQILENCSVGKLDFFYENQTMFLENHLTEYKEIQCGRNYILVKNGENSYNR